MGQDCCSNRDANKNGENTGESALDVIRGSKNNKEANPNEAEKPQESMAEKTEKLKLGMNNFVEGAKTYDYKAAAESTKNKVMTFDYQGAYEGVKKYDYKNAYESAKKSEYTEKGFEMFKNVNTKLLEKVE